MFGKHYPLFKWLVTALYIFMGVQFFLLWLLGEYIGRMYDQIKDRPLYIIQKKVGGNIMQDVHNKGIHLQVAKAKESAEHMQ